ncbi:MAG: succinate--CoA ligase subunit alpha [Thermoleophilaceae bacterium]
MAFLVDNDTRIVVQGLTGATGRMAAAMMKAGGAEIVAGVTPGKGGTTAEGVPVFDTVAEARVAGATASILFVPAALLRDAALEAIDAGMDPIVLMVDGVPLDVSLELVNAARERGVSLIGPNSPGVISPGKSLLGALRPEFYAAGDVALISRSGGMMTTIAHQLTQSGRGQSTCVGVGGDAVIGLDVPTAALLAEADPETKRLLVFGEVGTSNEERLADLVREGHVAKPVYAYIAGAAAPAGKRYSHAGASADEAGGGAEGKRRVLREAGITVLDRYIDAQEI